jgi:hypothetical protein
MENRMSVNKRQSILTQLDTKLKTILTTNSFETNAGSNVYEWHPYGTPVAQMPALAYRDTTEEITTVNDRDQHIHKLTIDILGYTSGSTAFTQARQLLADINSAIDDDRKFGGYVDDVVLLSQNIDAAQNDTTTAVVMVTVELWYLTGEFDAYGL